VKSAVAGPEAAGERLDVALARMAGISRARAQKLIEQGARKVIVGTSAFTTNGVHHELL